MSQRRSGALQAGRAPSSLQLLPLNTGGVVYDVVLCARFPDAFASYENSLASQRAQIMLLDISTGPRRRATSLQSATKSVLEAILTRWTNHFLNPSARKTAKTKNFRHH